MTYQATVLADSPYFYLRLGEAAGTTAADASGNGRTGTYVNGPMLGATALVSGDANTSMETVAQGTFATSQYVVSSALFNAASLNNFSIEVIVNMDDVTLRGNIAGVDTNGGSFDFLQIWMNNDGSVEFFVDNSDPTPTSSNGGVFLANGTTYHIVATFDASNPIDGCRLYINGLQVDASTVSSPALIADNGNQFYVATDEFDGDDLSGSFQEVAYYASTLSDARVLAHAVAAGLATGDATVNADAVAVTATVPEALFEWPMAIEADAPDVWWRLNEPSGTTVNDSSGNAHPGTYNGTPTLNQTGVVVGANKAVAFPTDADFAEGVDDFAATFSSGLSLEAIIKINTSPTTGPVYFGFHHNFTPSPVIVIDTSGVLYFEFLGPGPSFTGYSETPFSYSTGTYYHVVGTYDSVAQTVNLYVDGVLIDSQSATEDPFLDTPGTLDVPYWFSTTDGAFTVDEFIVYDSALSAARVRAHYHAITASFTAGGGGTDATPEPDVVTTVTAVPFPRADTGVANSFIVSDELKAYLKTWPSAVTVDITEIQDFQSTEFPSPRTGPGIGKSTSIYHSKSDGTLYQIFVGDSVMGNDTQVSEF